MIPLRDNNPARTVPYITYILVALNVVVFLYNGTLANDGRNPLAGFELVPAHLFKPGHFGAAGFPSWVTIFTSMFLHANLLHVGGNMLYLWIFGNNVEDALGHFKYLVFYLLAGLGAAMAQVLLSPMSQVPMVGASGAIAGVLAAYLVLFPGAKVVTLVIYFFIQVVELPAAVLLGWWIIIQILSSVMSGARAGGGVAYAAHVGGFAAGYLMIAMLGGRGMLGRQGMVAPRDRTRW